MSQQIYCQQCGELNDIVRYYCNNCGAKIKQLSTESPQPPPVQQPAPIVVVQQPPRSTSPLGIICLVCLIIGCLPILSSIIYFIIVPMFR